MTQDYYLNVLSLGAIETLANQGYEFTIEDGRITRMEMKRVTTAATVSDPNN